MRVLFLVCTVLAVARAFPDPRAEAFRQMTEAIDDAKELANNLFGDSRRANSACAQIPTGQSTAQLSSLLQTQMKVPSTCTDPMVNFMVNVMCSPACQASTIFNSNRRTVSERVLLGGSSSSSSNASTMCVDPCFQLTIGSSGITSVFAVVTNPLCAAMFTSSNRRAAARNLLGGNSTTTTLASMTTMFQVICSKNSNGKYCMDLIPTISPNVSTTVNYTTFNISGVTSASQSSALPITILSQNCIYDTPSVSQLRSIGCCYGVMQQVVTLFMTSQTDIDSFQTSMCLYTAAAAGCGVTLSTTPCSASGVAMTYVSNTVGIGVPNCSSVTPAVSVEVAKAIAATAGVSSKNVQITKVTCSSRRVTTATFAAQTQVPVSGASAATISSNLQNTVLLTTNLNTQTAGTSLAGQVSVTTVSTPVINTAVSTTTGGGRRIVGSVLAIALLSAMVMAW